VGSADPSILYPHFAPLATVTNAATTAIGLAAELALPLVVALAAHVAVHVQTVAHPPLLHPLVSPTLRGLQVTTQIPPTLLALGIDLQVASDERGKHSPSDEQGRWIQVEDEEGCRRSP
jgi:hypothetical protein